MVVTKPSDHRQCTATGRLTTNAIDPLHRWIGADPSRRLAGAGQPSPHPQCADQLHQDERDRQRRQPRLHLQHAGETQREQRMQRGVMRPAVHAERDRDGGAGQADERKTVLCPLRCGGRGHHDAPVLAAQSGTPSPCGATVRRPADGCPISRHWPMSEGRARLGGMSETLAAIGTVKGLFLARSSDRAQLAGVRHPVPDERRLRGRASTTRAGSPRLFVSATSEHWGPSVFHSDDLGQTWAEPEKGSIAFPDDTGASLERVWQIAPSPTEPDVVWAGSAAQRAVAVRGRRRALRTRPRAVGPPAPRRVGRRVRRAGDPHRARAPVRPGADPRSRCRPAASTAPRTAATSWQASNTGVKAYFMPDPWPGVRPVRAQDRARRREP